MNFSKITLTHHRNICAACLLALFFCRPTHADTFILDFDSTATDIFNQQTGSFVASSFNFTGLDREQAKISVFNAVRDHFLDYPTIGQDANSPLPTGMELDWNFEIGTFGTAPTNGDANYFYIKIGTGLSGNNATNQNVFGAACGSCVRNSSGNGPSVSNGSIVGSVWTDHIDNIAGLASDDAQRVNLIAGTTSHEIGHTFSLAHAGAMDANPGESQWGVMGSGATSMPNAERVLSREFTYAKFGQLMGAVGIRNSIVPEPGGILVAGTFGCIVLLQRRRVQL